GEAPAPASHRPPPAAGISGSNPPFPAGFRWVPRPFFHNPTKSRPPYSVSTRRQKRGSEGTARGERPPWYQIWWQTGEIRPVAFPSNSHNESGQTPGHSCPSG